MRLGLLERNAEYVLSVLFIGLATFLLREVWASVQVLEDIFKALLEGAIFTEGPPIVGVKQYLLFCLVPVGIRLSFVTKILSSSARAVFIFPYAYLGGLFCFFQRARGL